MNINIAVCKLPITSSISNISRNSDSFAGIVPKAQKKKKKFGTITVFTVNCLLTSAAKSMYLSIFSSSFSLTRWSNGIVKSAVQHVFSSLSITHFPISLYWFVSGDCYFAIICLYYNIGDMAVSLISCRDPILLG